MASHCEVLRLRLIQFSPDGLDVFFNKSTKNGDNFPAKKCVHHFSNKIAFHCIS